MSSVTYTTPSTYVHTNMMGLPFSPSRKHYDPNHSNAIHPAIERIIKTTFNAFDRGNDMNDLTRSL